MRSITDFYRRNPLVLAIAVVVGLGLSVLTAVAGSDGILGPVILAVLVGVGVGLGIAFVRAGDDDDDDTHLDGDDPRRDG